MPEYLKWRCCLCPNINEQKTICPAIYFKQEETQCRFVKIYIDAREWLFKVMYDDYDKGYKSHYKRPGRKGWSRMSHFEFRESFDDAQADLNSYAEKKGWKEWKELN